VPLLLLALVEGQVAVVEQLVDVVGHAVVVQVVVLHDHALAGQVVDVLSSAGNDDFLHFLVEFDVLFAGLELKDLDVADELAGQVGRERAAQALVADHDAVALVLEHGAHGLAHLADGLVEEDLVDLGAARVAVVDFDLLLQRLDERVVLVGEVVLLPGVVVLGEHEEGLGLEFLLALALEVEVLGVRALEGLDLLLLEVADHDFLHDFELLGDVGGVVEAVEELPVEFVLEHFGQLVVANLDLDVDAEDALEHLDQVLEGEDLVLLAFVGLEVGLHDLERVDGGLGHVFDVLAVLELLDFLVDRELEALHVLGFFDGVHVELHELV